MNQLYEMVGISKQAVWEYAKRQRVFEDRIQQLLVLVDELRENHPGCGVEKMYWTLLPDFIGRDRFVEILMDLGYRVWRPKNYTRTTIPASFQYDNLVEGMMITDINQVWQSDITFFRIRDQFYYMVFILDVYSRRIIGWRASGHMRATANLKALKQAIRLRQNRCLGDLIHHSDRGSQYIDSEYTDLLRSVGAKISMGKKGSQNAYAERINGTIKNEYLQYWEIESLAQLKRKLNRAVKNYNTVRIHKELPERMNPVEFEEKVINLAHNERPIETVFAEGYPSVKQLGEQMGSHPEKELPVHTCPIEVNQNFKT